MRFQLLDSGALYFRFETLIFRVMGDVWNTVGK